MRLLYLGRKERKKKKSPPSRTVFDAPKGKKREDRYGIYRAQCQTRAHTSYIPKQATNQMASRSLQRNRALRRRLDAR